MNNFQNNRFIKTKISNILLEYIGAISNISSSFNFFPISEFILQSLFLKLTGAQEQKFRSMVWEWGCIDLSYRRKVIESKNDNYYSRYEEKVEFLTEVYKSIDKNIKIDNSMLCDDSGMHLCDMFIKNTCECMKRIFVNTDTYYCKTNMFKKYWNESIGFINSNELIIKQIKNNELLLFTPDFISNCYEQLYTYRNKCAHNLFVYQNPYPTFKEYVKKGENDNIFKWIQTLLIIDEISIYFFKKLEKS